MGRDDRAHAADDLRLRQDVGHVHEAAGQHAARGGQRLGQILHRSVGVLRREDRAVAHAAGGAGDGVQLAQTEL